MVGWAFARRNDHRAWAYQSWRQQSQHAAPLCGPPGQNLDHRRYAFAGGSVGLVLRGWSSGRESQIARRVYVGAAKKLLGLELEVPTFNQSIQRSTIFVIKITKRLDVGGSMYCS